MYVYIWLFSLRLLASPPARHIEQLGRRGKGDGGKREEKKRNTHSNKRARKKKRAKHSQRLHGGRVAVSRLGDFLRGDVVSLGKAVVDLIITLF